ncbi:hypothetical protein SAY86_001990 [Trapa natans]|uniref:Uncharacterized protein n=1 Tax=Trapa natans TaxID=22666 RepID=A0AAN7LRA4_TRANT|nr:hypothetical protein SAY86_001990 [Trapa natans]
MATEGLDAALMARAGSVEAESGHGGAGEFPSEFPYEIDTPVNSILSSSEMAKSGGDDNAEVNEEVEDFLAELTRRLTRSSGSDAKKSASSLSFRSKTEALAVSNSPKSTLTGLRGWPPNHGSRMSRDASPNGGSTTPSSPVTPFPPEDSQLNWNLIYTASEKVAKLRPSGQEAKLLPHPRPVGAPVCPVKSHRLAAAMKPALHSCCSAHMAADGFSVTNQYWNAQDLQVQRAFSPRWPNIVKANLFVLQNQKIQNMIKGIEFESFRGRWDDGRLLVGAPRNDLPSPHPQNAQQNMNRPDLRALFNVSGSVRGHRAGTGVFLPRRYENPAPKSLKRSGCTTVPVPPKVVHAPNLNLGDADARPQPYFASDYDTLMARRNAILELQKTSLRSCLKNGLTKT